jgi:phosphoglycerol transferase MdoB-like AlkP superfamily enzyme
VPHDPFVVDGQCRHAGNWRSRPEKIGRKEAYLQQAECGVRKVVDFLQGLKRLKRYDTATIVLHGDHGNTQRFRTGTDRSGAGVLGRPRAGMLSRVQALLAIKRPDAPYRLEVVERPTQLVDIYPTVLDLLGLEPPAGLHGRSVYASAAPAREARFALDPKGRYGNDLIEVRIEDRGDLVTPRLTVVGRPDDPALWREEVRRAARTSAAAIPPEPDSDPPGVARSLRAARARP